jgi:hypothetical protein
LALPVKTVLREDGQHLLHARRALDDAKAALKAFSRSRSVMADAKLLAGVDDLRRRLKRVRKLARSVNARWMDLATR